ncbi:hypothetical protein H5410_047838 [Solanum commersonii]|uniref:Xylanase inhibitor C-terminal domain-containing protein n=1 Tax=Solanum commersonii TaxID=4109 RepID=A0A9J5XJF3_SOLCO|nr:hypothetical protein H5410_047838 [Solanum commersonii]
MYFSSLNSTNLLTTYYISDSLYAFYCRFTSSDVQSFSDILYFQNLEIVSVGGKKLEFKSSHLMNSSHTDEDSENVIIDSSMTLTFLIEEIYSKLESTLLEMIKGKIKLCDQFKYTLLVI